MVFDTVFDMVLSNVYSCAHKYFDKQFSEHAQL